MKKERFDKLEIALKKRGYKRYNQTWHNEDYVIGKGFHKKDNKWDDGRSPYVIGLSVYDYSDKNYPTMPIDMRDHVGLAIIVCVSRTIDERIELHLIWDDDTKIEDIEKKAESFYQWVCDNYEISKKEEQ